MSRYESREKGGSKEQVLVYQPEDEQVKLEVRREGKVWETSLNTKISLPKKRTKGPRSRNLYIESIQAFKKREQRA